jgi:hypothetical protein
MRDPATWTAESGGEEFGVGAELGRNEKVDGWTATIMKAVAAMAIALATPRHETVRH